MAPTYFHMITKNLPKPLAGKNATFPCGGLEKAVTRREDVRVGQLQCKTGDCSPYAHREHGVLEHNWRGMEESTGQGRIGGGPIKRGGGGFWESAQIVHLTFQKFRRLQIHCFITSRILNPPSL